MIPRESKKLEMDARRALVISESLQAALDTSAKSTRTIYLKILCVGLLGLASASRLQANELARLPLHQAHHHHNAPPAQFMQAQNQAPGQHWQTGTNQQMLELDSNQQPSYYTGDHEHRAQQHLQSNRHFQPTAQHDQYQNNLELQQQQHHHHHHQMERHPHRLHEQPSFVAYRASSEHNQPATAPSLPRQLLAPPPFNFELALTPMNTIQLQADESRLEPAAVRQQADRLAGARDASAVELAKTMVGEPSARSAARDADTLAESQAGSAQTAPLQTGAEQASSSGSSGNVGPETNQVDKTIEPRQRRRIFNRILKKAEWNHLFVEVSKVFLRYFLDLALKDIIGKQSGGSSSSLSGSASDSTTSRKKLDAQSEIAELFKDFVKTAISNL